MAPPTEEMLRLMLDLQDGMNRKINPHWTSAGYPFLRAVVVEAVEGLEHHGWKWWKSQSPDLPQLRIELVDIWHFVLSEYLVRADGDATKAARAILRGWTGGPAISFDGLTYHVGSLDIPRLLELLAATAAVRRIAFPLVVELLERCDMPAVDLFRQYVSKNVLNHFRQDHGYKTGEYRKFWDGREDNVHLADILESLGDHDASVADKLYAALTERYLRYCAAGQVA